MGSMDVISEALAEIGKNILPLTKALLSPVLLILISVFLNRFFSYTILDYGILIFIIFQTAIIAVTTHRVILLGPDSVPVWGIYKPSIREFYFAVNALGLAIISYLSVLAVMVSFLGSFFAKPTEWNTLVLSAIAILGIFMTWYSCRLFLVLPSIAINQGMTFKFSWKLTKNHHLLMFMVIFVLPFVVAVTFVILDFFLSFIPLSGLIFTLLEEVIIIAMLSVTYRNIYAESHNK